jgi:hypothetical protein
MPCEAEKEKTKNSERDKKVGEGLFGLNLKEV